MVLTLDKIEVVHFQYTGLPRMTKYLRFKIMLDFYKKPFLVSEKQSQSPCFFESDARVSTF